jgi:superfamily II DNA or RNA helicase
MVASLFALKDYQQETLEAFKNYLKEIDKQKDPGVAFYA